MKCRKTESYLTEYFYDTPDKKRLGFLESHFTSCSDCQQARVKYESTLEMVDKREKVETDKVFWTDFHQRLEQNLREKPRPQRLRNILEHIQAGLRNSLPRPVLVRSVLMTVILITVIGVGVKMSPEIPDNGNPIIAVSDKGLDVNDYVLLTDILDQETDMDIMQELVAEEEIDYLLEQGVSG